MRHNEAIKAEMALLKALEHRVEHDQQAKELVVQLRLRVYTMSLDTYNAELQRELAEMKINKILRGNVSEYCEPTKIEGPLLRVATVGCCVVCEN